MESDDNDLTRMTLSDLIALEAKAIQERDALHNDFIVTEHSPTRENYWQRYLETRTKAKEIRREITARQIPQSPEGGVIAKLKAFFK